jgi:hypothetical protein
VIADDEIERIIRKRHLDYIEADNLDALTHPGVPVDVFLIEIPTDVGPGRMPRKDVWDESHAAAGTKRVQSDLGVDAEEGDLLEDMRGLLDPAAKMTQCRARQPRFGFLEIQGEVHVRYYQGPPTEARWQKAPPALGG